MSTPLPSEICERFPGGVDGVAAEFGLSSGKKAIEQWDKRGRVPGRYHLPFLAWAEAAGVSLKPEELEPSLSTTSRTGTR